jgi:p21-activated kinase 1
MVFSEFRRICKLSDPLDLYEFDNEIGKGSYYTLHLAKEKATQQLFAVKKITVTADFKVKSSLLQEIKMHMEVNLKCPNIVEFHDAFWLETNGGGTLFLVLEYMDGGCLTDVAYETVMRERQIAVVCHEVLQAIIYLHDNGIIHRDIKSDNIWLGIDGRVKLMEFSSCAIIRPEETRKSIIGTPYWYTFFHYLRCSGKLRLTFVFVQDGPGSRQM